MKLPPFSCLPLLLCLLLPPAFAQPIGTTVATDIGGSAENAKGAEMRDQVNAVWGLVRAKKLPEAELAAADLQKKFESSFDSAQPHYSFQSREEYLEFKSASPQAFEWIDWGYKECLQIQAFIAADRRNFPAALSLLTAIEAIAPVSAGTLTERGYILNQLGKPEDAMAAYKRALALSRRYRSQQQHQAVALRGVGFALIELHRLDEAEAAFQESLKTDPNSQVAMNELAYIRQVRAKSAPKPAAAL